MTDIREKLAEVAEEAIDNVHDMDVTLRDYAEAVADAILDALPGIVPLLVWTKDQTGLYVAPGSGMPILFDERGDDGTQWMLFVKGTWKPFGSFEAAKAAANAHHAATLMAALGVKVE